MVFTAYLLSLFVIINVYFFIAKKYTIIDKPNQRSSHSAVTIRGGGIIFGISVVLFELWTLIAGEPIDWFLLGGIVLVSTMSFIDDILTIKPLPRFFAHLVSVLLLFQSLHLFNIWSWWVLAITLVFCIGWINTFNFMDGINGITVLYALSVVMPIFLLSNIGNGESAVPSEFYTSVIAGLLVFGFFNVRKKAKAFAGDVGSVAMALIIAYVLLNGMKYGWGWSSIVMMSVYGIDSVGTILQRLKRRENIFEAHRTHLYQYMANEAKMPHVLVSTIYAVLQVAINVGWFLVNPQFKDVYSTVILVLLAISYFPIKRKVIENLAVKL